jgi:methylglutaconyl-CoA hydratase
MSGQVHIRKDVPSATIRIDHGAAGSALTPSIVDGLLQAFDDLHGEKKVRGVILTGTGDRFCSGTDLRELARQISESATRPQVLMDWQEETGQLLELLTTILRFPKPVVAAVNGAAAGTGLALALACDFVVCSRSGTWALPESRRGLVAGLAAPLVAFRAGNSVARQLALTGREIDAAEAYRLGLVDELVDADLIWARAHELVRSLAESSPASQQLAKQLCNETIGEALFVQLANGAANMAAARFTAAARLGVEAFLEKRPVDWNEL